VTDLTNAAGGFVVVAGMRVRNKLHEKKERKQRKQNGQRFE